VGDGGVFRPAGPAASRARTKIISAEPKEQVQAREVLRVVFEALQEKGYNPVSQIASYLISGDPVYITAHRDARNLVRKLDPQEVVEELVRSYLEGSVSPPGSRPPG